MARGAGDERSTPGSPPLNQSQPAYPGPSIWPLDESWHGWPPRRRRGHWIGWTLVALAMAAGLVIMLGLWWTHGWSCYGGDGGEPFTAPDSPQGELCHSAGPVTSLLLPLGWSAGSAVLIWICTRWAQVRSGVGWLILLLAPPIVAPIDAFAALNAPSDECSPDRRTDPVYECDHY